MEFKEISIADRDEIEQRVRLYGAQNCDFAFAALLGWANSYKSLWCRLDDFLIIKYAFNKSDFAYCQPLGPGDYSYLLPQLEQDARENAMPFRMILMDEGSIECLRNYNPGLAVYFLREHSDYIYLREDLVNLKGSKYQPKRNHIHKFSSLYDYKYSDLTASDVPQCLSFLAKWDEERESVANLPADYIAELEDERICILRQMNNFDALGLRGGIIRVDGNIVAFCYGSALSEDTFCTHIEKADEHFDGVYSVINQEFASHLPDNFKYLNREDDLGYHGLRQAKESYHPSRLLNKFIAEEMDAERLQVRQLWKKCFAEDSLSDIDQFLMTEYKKENMMASYDGGRLVSMMHIVPFGDTAYIYAVATDPQYRHRGLSSSLLLSTLGLCRERGFARAALIPASESLRQWYSSFGFSGCTPMSVVSADGYDFGTGDKSKDMAMIKNL